jgi:Tol biopolymer transport system component
MASDGTNLRRVTDDPGYDANPTPSPDGSRVAFGSQRDGNWEVYVASSSGGPATRLTRNRAIDDYPRWSADGSEVKFLSSRRGAFEIWLMSSDTGAKQRLAHRSAALPLAKRTTQRVTKVAAATGTRQASRSR